MGPFFIFLGKQTNVIDDAGHFVNDVQVAAAFVVNSYRRKIGGPSSKNPKKYPTNKSRTQWKPRTDKVGEKTSFNVDESKRKSFVKPC